MLKRTLFVLFFFCAVNAQAQQSTVADSTIDYDELFNEMEDFMDSLLAPHSFTIINLGISSSYYNYQTAKSVFLETQKKVLYTPSIGFFHKNGLGISAVANIILDEKKLNPYQVALTGSYDYLKNPDFSTGLAYTRIFTKNNLPFYTSPLQNNLSLYFIYRKPWFKPSVTMNYGWGSRSSYEQREEQITSLRLREKGFTRVNTTESVNDLSIAAAIRHDFYWLNLLSKKDYLRLTPQLSFTSGSQKFGLNQSSSTYGITRLTGNSVLFSTDEAYLDDQLYFQPLSLTATIRVQYSFGKFFVQPQFMCDYYFPAKENNLSTLFMLNTGFVF